ncbi:MAG TPA: hypothetical protein VFH66_14080 [Mycobacteriales bacterium]|nr:hypothetical protein [Mycobacteriales bacterium]
MSDIRLPQRPVVELAPPVDGLEQVRGEAGRRRRRRAGVTAAGLTTAAGLAVVVAVSGGAAGIDVLKPAPPAGQDFSSPAPTATAPRMVALDPVSPRHRHAAPRPAGRQQQAGGAQALPSQGTTGTGPSGTATSPTRSGQVSRSQGPTLTRWQSTYTGGPRECTGSTYGDSGGTLQSAVGWCAAVTATPLSRGVRLQFQLCRDSTGRGTLTFPGTREVDFAVDQGSRTIWDWAKLHPGGAGTHQLSANANGCWNWSLLWPDVTQTGASAGHGTFTFVGTSTANEMKGAPEYSATFGY